MGGVFAEMSTDCGLFCDSFDGFASEGFGDCIRTSEGAASGSPPSDV